MKEQNLLEAFGELVIRKVRDRVISEINSFITGETNAPNGKELNLLLKNFSQENKEALNKFILRSIDSSLHYTLFMFEQNNEEFDIIANPESSKPISLTKLSDGLCGELYSDDGWIKKYSKYPSSYD